MVGFGHKIVCFLREVDRLVSGKIQMPVSFEIDASNYCQNDCGFCMFASHIKANRVHLSEGLFLKVLWDFYQHGGRSITFTGGGEPLMNPKIGDYIKQASDLGIKIGLVTNGILLPKIFPVLDKLEFVRVSLDAATAATYRKIKHTDSFDDITQNVLRTVMFGMTDVGLSFVITKDNKHEIDAFGTLAEDLGVHYAQVKPELVPNCDLLAQTKDIDGEKFFVTERYNMDRDKCLACDIAGLVGILGATGKVYYCCVQRGRLEFEIGDVREHSIRQLYGNIRPNFVPDTELCETSCRYMNYAKIYKKVRDRQFTPLRHRRFI